MPHSRANLLVSCPDRFFSYCVGRRKKGSGGSPIHFLCAFFFLCGGGEKKGLVNLQYIFCACYVMLLSILSKDRVVQKDKPVGVLPTKSTYTPEITKTMT